MQELAGSIQFLRVSHSSFTLDASDKKTTAQDSPCSNSAAEPEKTFALIFPSVIFCGEIVVCRRVFNYLF